MKILNLFKSLYKKITEYFEYRKMIKKLKQEDPFIYK